MSVNSKMTALADEIRELSGTTGVMGLDAMTTRVGEANEEIGDQVDLISQIQAALQGKASGGSSGDNSELAKQFIEGTVTNVIGNSAEKIGNYAFAGCTNLTTVSFPQASTIGGYAFSGCSNLTTANFPQATSTGIYAFRECLSLATVSFPQVTTIGASAFLSCRRLAAISFPQATTIGGSAFRYCYKLSSITLGSTAVCTLTNSNAFTSTPYAGYSTYFSGTPYIYVPASLVSAYQTATNWTYFSSYFSIIEVTSPT